MTPRRSSKIVTPNLSEKRRSARRSATTEAITHFRNGLAQIDLLPKSASREELKLTFLIHYGAQLLATHGFAAKDVQETYRRAMELCQDRADSPTLLPIYWGLWGYHIVRADLREAARWGEELLALATRLGDPVAAIAARCVSLGTITIL